MQQIDTKIERHEVRLGELAKAIGDGVVQVFPNAELTYVPGADGGDGTVDALVESSGGKFYESIVKGQLG